MAQPALRSMINGRGAVSLIATNLRLAHEGQMWQTSGSKRLPLGQGDRAAKLVSFTIDKVAL